jgi:hypothetical protein
MNKPDDEPRFPVGTRFIRKNRHCTVVDVHRTYNLAGYHIRTRYVATHEFMGQLVTEYDLAECSIQMGLIK